MNLPPFVETLKEKIKNTDFSKENVLAFVKDFYAKAKVYPYKETAKKYYKQIRSYIKKVKPLKFIKKMVKKLSDSWKFVLIGASSFLFFYYFIGSYFAENIDTNLVYALPRQKTEKSEMANTMAFLINREIDGKMWTPNLPMIFPASVLDNMPNFQIGIIKSVRDNTSAMRKFMALTEKQTKDLKQALQYLRYEPNVWIMSRKSTFSLAPSSNSQYRKGRKELIKYNKDGMFVANKIDFERYLQKLSESLQRNAEKIEEHIQEHSSDMLDFKDDDLFYYNRGYAFGAWQIAEAAGLDFKNVILESNVYTQWTYLLSSLQKIVEYEPVVVRNSELDSLFGANHLVVQSYYLQRARAAVEKVRATLLKGADNAY